MSYVDDYYFGLSAQGFHKLFFRSWGPHDAKQTLLCVHGLTRNSGDFDFFAAQMQDSYRVVCADVVGRGQSHWLRDKSGYQYPQYMADLAVLLGRLNVRELDYVGTSMGGALGIFLAALPNSPIRKLVLNDVGPFASREALLGISRYAGNDERFNSFDEVIIYFQQLYTGWGELPQESWRHVAERSSTRQSDGTYSLAYDPGIMQSAKKNPELITDINIWPVFERIQCPVLVLHGVESTVLTNEVAQEMKQRGKNVDVVDFPGIGHAPHLMSEAQVEVVRHWLKL